MIDTKEGWRRYQKRGIIESDDLLLAMIKELVSTIQVMERMYGTKRSSLFVRPLLSDWLSLYNMAASRGIKSIPHP